MAGNVPAKLWIHDAYDLRDVQIVGGPAWATGDFASAARFDSQATFAPNTPEEQVLATIRGLMQERFRLQTQFEDRDTRGLCLDEQKPGQSGERTGAAGSERMHAE